MKRIDLVGQRFGLLVVVSYAAKQRWAVRCDCGAEKVIAGNHLRRGATKSCGCSSRDWTRTTQNRNRVSQRSAGPRRDLVGKVFGQLTVLALESPETQNGRVYHRWRVRCVCGCEKVVFGQHLTSNGLQSCGCLKGTPLGQGLAARNQTLARYQQQARQRGYAWQLSDTQAFELFQAPCHYCGRPPQGVTAGRGLRGAFTYSGIDRKDNRVGYTPGNTVSCCRECNRGKGTLGYEEFLRYLQAIRSFWNAVPTQLFG